MLTTADRVVLAVKQFTVMSSAGATQQESMNLFTRLGVKYLTELSSSNRTTPGRCLESFLGYKSFCPKHDDPHSKPWTPKSLTGRRSVSSWCATESPGRTEPARTLLSSVSHSHEAFSSISWSSWRWAARPACSREQQTGGFMSRACWWNQAQAGSATFQTFRRTLSRTDLGTTIRQFYKCQ